MHEHNELRKQLEPAWLIKKEIKTRIMTSFIYAIAQMEDIFGDLWKHDEEDDSKLTEKELFYDELYEKFRKRVLDNGNLQIRLAFKALDEFYRDLKNDEIK